MLSTVCDSQITVGKVIENDTEYEIEMLIEIIKEIRKLERSTGTFPADLLEMSIDDFYEYYLLLIVK